MIIIKDLKNITTPFAGAVVTLGNFDGIHLGHREIFRRVVAKAKAIQGTSVVYTFVPHPLKVLAPDRALRLINTYEEKERLIEASCIDVLISAPFTIQTARLSATEFVEDILVRTIGVKHLVVGYDYAFGKNREGNVDFLQEMGRKLGFSVEVVGPVTKEGLVYSSTRIRQLIGAGDVAEVVRYLGRHFTLEGQVVHGQSRGRTIGIPTANLSTDKELLPRPGVYAVKVRWQDSLWDGVANIGTNPTFGGSKTTIEVHILGFSGEIYGDMVRIYFVEHLRDEVQFPSVELLVKAIHADICRARQILAETPILEYRDYLDCGLQDSTLNRGGAL